MALCKGWSSPLVAIAASLVLGGVAACHKAPAPRPPLSLGLRECPHTWYWDSLPNHVPDLAGPTTNVPEFNDCQRFIRRDGTTYDSLYAIFAAADLGPRFSRLQMLYGDTGRSDTARSDTTKADTGKADTAAVKNGLAVGEVWSDGGTYDDLGLKPGFNCLFLYYAGDSLAAKMVPVGMTEKNCVAMANVALLFGTDLAVKRLRWVGFGSAEIPNVARWDWDRVHRWQYIGIACGDAWCEVGPDEPDTFTSSPANTVAGLMTTAMRKVTAIKGWYDEQRLAMPIATGAGVSLAPGGAFGTATPDTGLDHYTISTFEGRWQHAARVRLEVVFQPLLDKWAVPSTAGRGPFEISLCHGSMADCNARTTSPSTSCGPTPDWWAKIDWVDPSGGRGAVYRCVKRVDHAAELAAAGITLPGTVRWRWVANDETLWMRCDAGCCTVY